MAFDSKWKGTASETDYGVAGNWDGDVPLSTEDALIGIGSNDITGTMDQTAVDLALWETGPKFTGTIGTTASPLILGATTVLRINSPYAKNINVSIAAAHTCATCYVLDAHPAQYGVYLQGPGTYTNLIVTAGKHVTIAADAIVTNLYADGGTIYLEEGAAIGNVYGEAATVYSNTTITTGVTINGGTFVNQGAGAEGNNGTVTVWGGTYKLNAKGGTVSNLIVHNRGRATGLENSNENTISAGIIRPGGKMYLNSQTVVTANIANYAGSGAYIGPQGTVDDKIPVPL